MKAIKLKNLCDRKDRASPRRRLLRIVRNILWLSLTHYATPPFPQKSRSARLFGCKRPHDGSLSLPTFADCGQGQALSLRGVGFLQNTINQPYNPSASRSFGTSLYTREAENALSTLLTLHSKLSIYSVKLDLTPTYSVKYISYNICV